MFVDFTYSKFYPRPASVNPLCSQNLITQVIVRDGIRVLQTVKRCFQAVVQIVYGIAMVDYYFQHERTVNVLPFVVPALIEEIPLIGTDCCILDDSPIGVTPNSHIMIRLGCYLALYGLPDYFFLLDSLYTLIVKHSLHLLTNPISRQFLISSLACLVCMWKCPAMLIVSSTSVVVLPNRLAYHPRKSFNTSIQRQPAACIGVSVSLTACVPFMFIVCSCSFYVHCYSCSLCC